jgi:hypothetical protein
MSRWRGLAGLFVAMHLVLCVGCGPGQKQSLTEIEQQRFDGAAAAKADWDRKDAGIYVFRQVAPGERDPATGLPLRDAGTDVVPPGKAAWVASYNAAVRQYLAAESRADAVQQMGRWSWNSRYGIRVSVAVPGGEIVDAKVIEYAQDGSIKAVPQTAFPAKDSISIIFDEYAGEGIGIAKYQISRSLVHRDGKVYVAVSGCEVEVR